METSKYKHPTLIALSVFFLFFMWPSQIWTFLAFFAFVPLLYLEHEISEKGGRKAALKLFLNTYLVFALWNLFTSYWIYKASLPGALIAVFANALLMTIPFLLFHKLKSNFRKKVSYLFLVSFWLSLEYLHLNWDMAWPWLNLGNLFAMRPAWVQWYEYTGAFGGSLWIFLVNVSVFKFLIRIKRKNYIHGFGLRYLSSTLLLICIPLIISYLIKSPERIQTNKNVVVVQPNIDPYNDKFDAMSFDDQLRTLINLSEKEIDSATVLLLWPETAISVPIDENAVLLDPYIQKIIGFLGKYPQVKLISGMDSYRFFEPGEKVSPTARLYADNLYYDRYNSAILLDHTGTYAIYHKNKLVPGVEIMPYPALFKFLETLVIDLGGASGSLGRESKDFVFPIDTTITAAPIICYESVFGELNGDMVNRGANLITVITNDGWWGSTDGYRQHFYYARLRAIETRKDIVRSANTGISAYISAQGTVLKQTDYWKKDVFKHSLFLNSKITFYTKYGDYIARIAVFVSLIMILILISLGLKRLIPLKRH
jgi:apolipoprotein N-acyltransferase